MSKSILSRFDDVWPPVTKDLEAWEVCLRLCPGMYRVQCGWHRGIKAAIQSGELPARIEKGEPAKTVRKQRTPNWVTGEPARFTTEDVPATPDRYFLERAPFRLWLVRKYGGTHDDSPAQKALSGPMPDERSAFTLRLPKNSSEGAWLIYDTAKVLWEESGQMPGPRQIYNYLWGDGTKSNDKTRRVFCVKDKLIYLGPGKPLTDDSIKKTFKGLEDPTKVDKTDKKSTKPTKRTTPP